MLLAKRTYEITQAFPPTEMYGMTSQLRRASVSVPANIAEGYGRESTASFIQFLRVAQGSLKELETLTMIAGDVNLLSRLATDELLAECGRAGILLRKLIRALQAKASAG